MFHLTTPNPIRAVCVGSSLAQTPFDACLATDVERLCAILAMGAPRQAQQVHGTRIDCVGDGLPCDAFLLKKGQAALVRHADCMPLVVCDPNTSQAVVAHCGWKGIQLGLPAACVKLLLASGAEARHLCAFAGPFIGPESFEVSTEFQLGFPAESRASTSWGTPSVDLGAVVGDQLFNAGLPEDAWTSCSIDTFRQVSWHSHRRDRSLGRNATLCWIPA